MYTADEYFKLKGDKEAFRTLPKIRTTFRKSRGFLAWLILG
jgi:hypothetical protein